MQSKEGVIFYGWLVVGASFLMLFLTTGIGFYTFSVFMIPLEDSFGASRKARTGVNSVMAPVAGFATPVVGILLHSWGPRKVIGFGTILAGAAYLLVSRADGVCHLYALDGAPRGRRRLLES